MEARVLSMSLVGGLLEASRYWAEQDHEENLADLVERALDVLEHGLPTPGKDSWTSWSTACRLPERTPGRPGARPADSRKRLRPRPLPHGILTG
ncbi:hypothetical protein KBY55_00210 [Streptomyces sp. b94]|uniref:hypothetical protein n=1 Tax=Streptomyces sp. b94 TaxID=1827634 RepID=UPI001B37BFCA|nr:hypothetical protein [Streptomyces sp. b94]